MHAFFSIFVLLQMCRKNFIVMLCNLFVSKSELKSSHYVCTKQPGGPQKKPDYDGHGLNDEQTNKHEWLSSAKSESLCFPAWLCQVYWHCSSPLCVPDLSTGTDHHHCVGPGTRNNNLKIPTLSNI